VQVIFGGGSVVGKLGAEKFNPMLFALIREGVSGPTLLALALWRDGTLVPLRKDWALILIMGLCVFSNQAFFIIGDKLAGPIISSAWQCSQPIFTLLISLTLGWEPATVRKLLGILLSFLGGAFLVCYGQDVGSPGAVGNVLLALNCLGTSLYVIFAKIALERYPPPDSHSLGHDVCKCDDGHFSRKSQQLMRLHSFHMSTHGHTRLHLWKLPGFMFSLVGASDCRSSPGILDHLPKHLSLFPTHLGQSLRPSWLHSGIHCPAAIHQYPS